MVMFLYKVSTTAVSFPLNPMAFNPFLQTAANFSGGGAKEMVTLTKTIMSKCPDTKVLYSGYSQGAMQVHQALGSLGPDASKIAVRITKSPLLRTALNHLSGCCNIW